MLLLYYHVQMHLLGGWAVVEVDALLGDEDGDGGPAVYSGRDGNEQGRIGKKTRTEKDVEGGNAARFRRRKEA